MRRMLGGGRTAVLLLCALAVVGGCESATGEADVVPMDVGTALVLADRLLEPFEDGRHVAGSLASAAAWVETQYEYELEPGGSAGLPVPAAIPAELRGKTLAYTVAQTWVVDEGRAGAPADGFRVIVYRTVGEGEIVQPLEEVGHVDVREEPAEFSNGRRLVLTMAPGDAGSLTGSLEVEEQRDEQGGQAFGTGYLSTPGVRLDLQDLQAHHSVNQGTLDEDRSLQSQYVVPDDGGVVVLGRQEHWNEGQDAVEGNLQLMIEDDHTTAQVYLFQDATGSYEGDMYWSGATTGGEVRMNGESLADLTFVPLFDENARIAEDDVADLETLLSALLGALEVTAELAGMEFRR